MIKLEHINKQYTSGSKTIHALRNVNLHIREGEVFGIIGRSGAGKSTLIRMLNLLERPSSGSVTLDGKEISALSEKQLRPIRQKIGMVFQHFNLLNSRTVLDNVCFPLRLAGMAKRERLERAQEVLRLVGLEEHAHKYPQQLSGGQQQRVGIARALANQPSVLLCDEATSALDPETTQSILRLLLDINQQLNLTIVLITHSMDVIRKLCDRVAVIEAGEIAELGDVVDVFLYPQQDVTRRLLEESGVDMGVWQTVAEGVPGRILCLSFQGKSTTQPLISQISRNLGLDISILQGTVSKIKEVSYGQLVIAVEADDTQLSAMQALLSQLSVRSEVLRS